MEQNSPVRLPDRQDTRERKWPLNDQTHCCPSIVIRNGASSLPERIQVFVQFNCAKESCVRQWLESSDVKQIGEIEFNYLGNNVVVLDRCNCALAPVNLIDADSIGHFDRVLASESDVDADTKAVSCTVVVSDGSVMTKGQLVIGKLRGNDLSDLKALVEGVFEIIKVNAKLTKTDSSGAFHLELEAVWKVAE